MTPCWQFISRLVVRRAGFPIERVLGLAFERAAAAIDALLDAEAAAGTAATAFLAGFNAAVEVARAADDATALTLLSKTRKRIAGGRARPAHIDPLLTRFAATDFSRLGGAYQARLRAAEAARDEARAIFAEELAAKRGALHAVFQDPWLREAVFTSNPHAFENGVEKFLDTPPDLAQRSGRAKAFERRLAIYLQRFCAKNDTASFFGPMNYGALGRRQDAPVRLAMEPGKFRARKVFYSFWMVTALAERIAREPSARPFLKPRLHAFWRLLGRDLVPLDGERRAPLSEATAALLRRLDGETLLSELRAGAEDPVAFDRLIEALAAKGVVEIEIPIPSTVFDPFAHLRGFVEAMPEGDEARERWLGHLDAFAELIGDIPLASLAERQRRAHAIEALFTRLTGSPARRMAGQVYADRTLYYEECDGTIAELSFNEAFTEDLAARLDPAMALSASYGQLLQRHYKRRALRAFREIAGGRAALPYGVFIGALEKAGDSDHVDPELDAFHAHFEALVAARAKGGVVQLSRADLAPLLTDDASLGLHTSPDLMFAAKDIAALARGDYRLVLGEVHQFLAMWGSQLLFDRDRAAVLAETQARLAELPNYQGLATVLLERHHKGLLHEAFPGAFIELVGRCADPAHDRVALRDLEVADIDGELVLRVAATGRRLTIYNSGDDKLHLWAFATPRVTNPAVGGDGHTPRIEIGDVVYQRERWRAPTAEFAAPDPDADDIDVFLAMRRARRRLGLPRFGFIRLESEKKPLFMDFDNFFLCELVHAALPNNDAVVFSEMLPGPGELWLADEAGSYCLEVRGTAFRTPARPCPAAPRVEADAMAAS